MRKRESGSGKVMDKDLDKSQILILLSILCLNNNNNKFLRREVFGTGCSLSSYSTQTLLWSHDSFRSF